MAKFRISQFPAYSGKRIPFEFGRFINQGLHKGGTDGVIEEVKQSLNPEVVYTHHGGDLNIDHRITCQAVLTAFRPQPGEPCTEILTFEVASATEWASPKINAPFLPETYVEITPQLSALEQACNCYADELREDPHARSLEAIKIGVRKRGREVGVEAAEAFMTLRRVIK